MSKWVTVPTPYIAERFIAFSIPDTRHFFLVSYEGIHEITFRPELSVISDGRYPEGKGVFDGRRITFKGETHATLGLFGGTAIVTDDGANVLALHAPDASKRDDGLVNVLASNGELCQSLPFSDFSGDWQCATFSTDYRHIVIGTPYTITIYRRE